MHVIIYGKPGCPHCAQAKMMCDIKGVEYTYHDVTAEPDGVASLMAKVGRPLSSLPQIFIEDGGVTTYVGGYNDLRAATQAKAA